MMRKSIALVVAAVMSTCAAGISRAEDYPTDLVRLVVPFPPGGGVDVIGRALAAQLGPKLGVDMFVENIPGSGGMVGTYSAAQARADGSTLSLANPGSHPIAAALYSEVPYDPVDDFTPIVYLGTAPYVLVVNKKVGIGSLQQLVDRAKAEPGALNYQSSSIGSAAHLAMELFEQEGGIEVKIIPYQGAAQGLVDLIAGRADFAFQPYSLVSQHLQSGDLIALGVAAPERIGSLPEVPTFIEAIGLDLEVGGWYGVVAPAGVPESVVLKVNAAVNDLLVDPGFSKALADLGVEPTGGTPESFAEYLASEVDKWAAAIEMAGVDKL